MGFFQGFHDGWAFVWAALWHADSAPYLYRMGTLTGVALLCWMIDRVAHVIARGILWGVKWLAEKPTE